MLCLLIVWDTSRRYIGETNVPSRGWLNWVVAAYAVGGALVALLYVPRVMAPQAAAKPSFGPGRFALMRWSFAMAPGFVGICAWMWGADEWLATFALGISFALLIVLARDLAAHRY
jgi:hypothetical protein